MSKTMEVTPILIKDDDKVYRILNIIFSSDNSIYFAFPSSKKRIISTFNEKGYDDTIYSEHVRTLNKFESESLEPKVSFHAPNAEHPDSTVVHINSNKIGSIINNKDVLNVGHNNDVFIYLMQIVVPDDLTFFDEYKNKHSKFIEIDNKKLNGETLSLEFIIHSTGIKQEEYYLPFSKNRRLRCIRTFITPNSLTCSVVISTLKGSKNDPKLSSLILSINTKEENGLYSIINENNWL